MIEFIAIVLKETVHISVSAKLTQNEEETND